MRPSRLRAFVMCSAGIPLCLAVVVVAQDLPDGPGKRSVELTCVSCHDLDTVTGSRRTKADWRATVDSMAARGATAPEEELTAIVEYLASYFGLVNVNKAQAAEIEAVLAIPSKDASEIVRYRSEHGDFKDLDDLKKVPGVDGKVLDERKDRIAFR